MRRGRRQIRRCSSSSTTNRRLSEAVQKKAVNKKKESHLLHLGEEHLDTLCKRRTNLKESLPFPGLRYSSATVLNDKLYIIEGCYDRMMT